MPCTSASVSPNFPAFISSCVLASASSSASAFTSTSLHVAQYGGVIVTLTSYSVSAVLSKSGLISTSRRMPPVVLAFISHSVAANLLTSALAFTWSSVSLTVLAFTSASLRASVLSNTLTLIPAHHIECQGFFRASM